MNSYTKLQSGAWGVRCEGVPQAGATVSVQTKAGAVKSETIERVLWTGPDRVTGQPVSVCAVAARAVAASGGYHSGGGHRRGGRYECEECGDWVTPGTRCWETGMTH